MQGYLRDVPPSLHPLPFLAMAKDRPTPLSCSQLHQGSRPSTNSDYIINNLTSHSEWVMTLVRAFTLRALQFNILVQARHAPGIENRLADALSHQQIELFRELDPGAKEFLEILPPEVCQIGAKTRKEQ